MVEHTTHNRVVGGSNPPTATTLTDSLLDPSLLDRGGMLVALSGGPDSTALLLSLLDLGIPVVAAHFDHDLRSGSSGEAAALAGACREWGVELLAGRRSGALPRGSLQAAARQARYDFLAQALVTSGLHSVALGHTADDLVEGTVMHLLRGSGLAGMRGMPSRRGPYLRPLLGTWRDQIEKYLAGRAATVLRDPSNLDPKFERVRIRLQLLPALERDRPGIKGRLLAAAARAAELQIELEGAAARLDIDGGRVRLAALLAVPAGVRVECVRRLYAAVTDRAPALSRRHHAAIAALVEGGKPGQTLNLPGGVRIRRAYQHVEMIGMVAASRPESGRLVLRACPGCAAGQAAHFQPGTELSLGQRRPGLRMRPLPGGRLRKLQDILVDAKVPRHTRDELPLVFAGGELAWVPGVAIDKRWAASPGQPSIHAEVVGGGNALLESVQPTQGVLS